MKHPSIERWKSVYFKILIFGNNVESNTGVTGTVVLVSFGGLVLLLQAESTTIHKQK